MTPWAHGQSWTMGNGHGRVASADPSTRGRAARARRAVALEPRRGQFDASYLDRVVAAVSMLNAHGLYVVLDMHFLGWSPEYGGSGAPAWATVQGIPDPHWGAMPSLTRLLSPAINVSTAYFWLTSD